MPESAIKPARARLLPWLAVLALIGYAIFLGRHAYVVPGGADSSGYFNIMRLLSHGVVKEPVRDVAGLPPAGSPVMLYSPLGFGPDDSRTNLVPTYAIGLPILLLAFRTFVHDAGANLTLIAHAVAGIALLYLLARRFGASVPAALLAVAALAFSPLYMLYSLQAMSDLPALVWIAAAIWLALLSREKTGWALAAGFAFGLAVLVRATNLVLLPVMLLATGWNWRAWLLFGCGGLPGAGMLVWFNWNAYGHIATTGYGDVSHLFLWENVPPCLEHYARWLPVVGTPLIVLALGFPWLVRGAKSMCVLITVWVLGSFGFYAFYYHTHELWWYLRFILPGLPALLIVAALVLDKLVGRWKTPVRFGIYAVVLFVTIFSNRYWNKHWAILNSGEGERVYADVPRWSQTHLPANAVIFSMQLSGALRYYTDFTLIRWDMLDGTWPHVRDTLVAQKRPVYATLFDFEEEEALKERTPGHWEKVAQIRQASVWRLQSETP